MRYLTAACVAAVLLAACAPANVEPNASAPTQSWMSPDAGNSPLLYVSDWNTNDVFVYNYTTHGLVGHLTGLRGPYGQCIDRARHIWITELNGFDVVQYAHGRTKPLRRLKTNGYPIGCAVNRNNGDLAVANFSMENGPGDVQVWKNSFGQPKSYRPTRLYYLWPPAYDNKDNLFVEGQVKNGAYGLTELPKNGIELRGLTLKGATLHYAGGVFWDGSLLGLTDQDATGNTTMIYRTAVSYRTATVEKKTQLTDDCHGRNTDVIAPFAVPNKHGAISFVVGGNVWCKSRFGYWAYPAGGNPRKLLADAPQLPYGQSVSPP